MDSSVIYRILLVLLFTVSKVHAIEFQGSFIQGHFILGKTDSKAQIKVNKKVSFSNIKVAAAFHGGISLNQQKKIPKVLKLMQFPCVDALSYAHLAEGKVDVVIQCGNKIWDIHPLIPIIEAAGGIVSNWF